MDYRVSKVGHIIRAKLFQHLGCIAICFIALGSSLTAQMVSYEFSSAKVSITGASTLHDWSVEASEVSDYPMTITLDPEGEGSVEDFDFKVAVSSMDGGRGSSMNGKIFKALKSKIHPYVVYDQNGPATYVYMDREMHTMIKSTGILEIAGVQQDVTIDVTARVDEGTIIFTASHAMKMTDFQIEPPTAMFGQIETKDDIVVNFEFTYKAQ